MYVVPVRREPLLELWYDLFLDRCRVSDYASFLQVREVSVKVMIEPFILWTEADVCYYVRSYTGFPHSVCCYEGRDVCPVRDLIYKLFALSVWYVLFCFVFVLPDLQLLQFPIQCLQFVSRQIL